MHLLTALDWLECAETLISRVFCCLQELAARLERLSAKTEAVEQARRDARRAEQEQRRQQQLWQQQSRLGAPPSGAGPQRGWLQGEGGAEASSM